VSYIPFISAAGGGGSKNLGYISPRSQVAIKGGDFTIECFSTTKPRWKKGNGNIRSRRRIKLAGNSLSVTSVIDKDADTYLCYGTTEDNREFQQVAEVEVGGKLVGGKLNDIMSELFSQF